MKKFVAHIRIEQHPNPDMRTYHLNRLVSKENMFGFGIEQTMGLLGDKDPGKTGKALAKGLEKVPGVGSGHFGAYEVSITKGSAFDWADVGPFVVGQIVKHLFPDFIGKEIEISTTQHYLAGDYSRHQDFVKHHKVKVKFYAKKRPRVDVEGLFNQQALREVVNNNPNKGQTAADDQKKVANGGE